MPEKDRLNRVAFSSCALAVCLFIFLSLVSFSIYDWPNPDVAPARVHDNLCGRTGAFVAYYSNYYLGPGSMLLLIALMAWFVFRCVAKPIEQMALRVVGVFLLTAAISGCWYLISPGGPGSLSQGNGGILGIAVGHFLLSNTAHTGAVLILGAGILVGLLLAADNLLLMIPALVIGSAERLRHAGPVLAGVGARAGALGEKAKRGLADTTRKLTVATPQQEAAIREVASLDEEQEEYEDDLYEEEESESKEDHSEEEETASEVKITKQSQLEEEAQSRSIAAVTSALVKLRGIVTGSKGTGGPSAGAGREEYQDYEYPPLELLEEPQHGFTALQEKVVRDKAKVLEQTLADFHIDARVVEVETGPVITMFELQLSPGIKVAQISNLANDLARSLGAPAVRVVAPIPGKHTIGIEVPNSEKEKVRIKELLQLSGDKPSRMRIPLFLGKDASGEPLLVDLTELPHLLIAGTTGSGKSVCINSIIASVILTQRPDMVKMILVDPKMVELNAFRDLPHLMCPIVTEMKRSEQILEWLTIKMDERYALLAEARVKNIAGYNQLTKEQIYQRFQPSNEDEETKIPLRLPYIMVVIDELADLMMTAAKEVEAYIIRLAQKSRAVGIHIVLATQRPQATVVTGLIKSNLPSRISFRVAARMDSRIVLDQNGAEALLGRGDMLFLQPGTSDLIRAQGTFLSDAEIHRLVKHLRTTAQAYYHPELMQLNQVDAGSMEKDELFDEAVKIIIETKRGSVSLLQRRLTIGYSRASRLVDQMAAAGIVGEYKGSQAREVLITMEEYEQIREQMEREAAQGRQGLQEDEEETEMEAKVCEPSSSKTRWLPPDTCPRPKTSVGMAPSPDEEEEIEESDEENDEYEEEEEEDYGDEEEEESVGGFVAGDEEEEEEKDKG